MDNPHISTYRNLTLILAVCANGTFFGGCSANSNGGWFSSSKKAPADQSAIDHTEVSQTAQKTESTPGLSSPDSSDSTAQSNSIPTGTNVPANTPPNSRPEISSFNEIITLYRRLHVEMPPEKRSDLIIELFSDHREQVCLLGFDLASRDLSSGATLSTNASRAVIHLLGDPRSSVRTESARLTARLALPDAMVLLTDALASEDTPEVAQALLLGLDRWPNPEARPYILRWYQTNSIAREAAATAVWSLVDLDLLNTQTTAPTLREVFRSLPDESLTHADLKLMAIAGNHQDLDRLIKLASNNDFPNRMNAAEAISLSPSGVDPLFSLANENPVFSPYAATAVQSHRLNPQGISRLAKLQWSNSADRSQALLKICERLDLDQLSDVVRLTRNDHSISDSLSISILNRLVAGTQGVATRSAPGVVMLANLELQNQRPDRAIEILSLLPAKIDPDSTLKAAQTIDIANILLTQFDTVLSSSPEPWFKAVEIATNPSIRSRIIENLHSRGFSLTQEQQARLNTIVNSTQDSLPEQTEP